MKNYMGHFGEGETTPVMMTAPKTVSDVSSESTALFTTVSNLADKSLTNTFDRAAQIAKSEEIQAFLNENGLAPYLKDVTQDRVKNILALFGLWSVYKAIKSPIGLAVVAATGGYILFTNKDKLIDKVAGKELLASNPVPTAPKV